MNPELETSASAPTPPADNAGQQAPSSAEPQPQPQWKPLPSMQRRIVGVLVEKAKTTPDQYPLSLNALTNGCNQKSNRSPQMNLQPDQVEDALETLRQIGAVGEVQGGGRVAKYRHYLKDWMAVSGPELAVMAELLLRGEQSVGDLRGRANRMTRNEIPDVSALRPLVAGLIERGLVVALTPAGRGQIVTHNLYEERELEKLRTQHQGAGPTPSAPAAAASPSRPRRLPLPLRRRLPPLPRPAGKSMRCGAKSRRLREEVARLKSEIEDLCRNFK